MKDSFRSLLLYAILLCLNFLHGIFASGFVPILHEALGERSTLAFSLYFVGILLGQMAVYLWFSLSRSPRIYCLYEWLFGFSLFYMAIWSSPFGLSSGRFLEGLAAGLAIPVLFANVIQLQNVGSLGTRLVWFNSVFALGFVLGPPLIAVLMDHMTYRTCLWLFGGVFLVIPAGLFFLIKKRDKPLSSESLTLKQVLSKGNWFETFYTLFLAKCFYGFLLTFTASHLMKYFQQLTLIQVMLILSGIYILGQIIASQLTSRSFPKEHLEVYAPLLLAASLLAFYVTHDPVYIFVAALFQSILVFVGYLNFGIQAASAREFALFNSLSDPAMILGSILAGLHLEGIWGLVLLSIVPLAVFLRMSPQFIRAEKWFPFVGYLSLLKIFKKHQNPLKTSRAKVSQKALTFAPYVTKQPESTGKRLRFVFTGDFCPFPPKVYQMSEEMKQFVQSHHFRLINLEGVQATQSYEEKTRFFQHSIPETQFEAIIPAEGKEPTFTLISTVNNHVLDLGAKAYERTLQTLEARSEVSPLTSDLRIQEQSGIKVGFFALTFGNNFFWRRHPSIRSLKPEALLANTKLQASFIEQLQAYKAQVDVLVVSYHWGYESEYWPSDVQKACFELFHSAGVDILYGHHSHTVQPFEVTEDKTGLCLYSCGNFLSDMPQKIYQQGVLYSIELTCTNSSTQVTRVTPKFFEPQADELAFIELSESEAYQNWKNATNT